MPASRALAAPSGEDPLGVRRDFPVTDTLTYLNTASRGPFSRVVRDASVAFADEKMHTGFASRRDEIREEARERFAALFGAKPEEIGILYSTTDGENIVASALDLGPGDNVVIDELHFVTSFVLYRELEQEKGIELRIVPQRDGRSDLEDFDARIDGNTKLVSVAWISNRNGFRQDMRGLAELAHRKGAFLYSDSIQAIGAFPTSLTDLGIGRTARSSTPRRTRTGFRRKRASSTSIPTSSSWSTCLTGSPTTPSSGPINAVARRSRRTCHGPWERRRTCTSTTSVS